MNRISISALTCLTSTALMGADPTEPGVMLRSGNWHGGVASYIVPKQFEQLKPQVWPNEGWQRIEIFNGKMKISTVRAPNRQRPKFLADLTQQLTRQAATLPVTLHRPLSLCAKSQSPCGHAGQFHWARMRSVTLRLRGGDALLRKLS